MRWLVAFLVLGNVGMYLWVTGLHEEASVNKYLSKPAVNISSMRLLNEPMISNPNSAETNSGQNLKVGKTGSICLRIGPFALQNSMLAASRRLEQLNLEYRSKSVKARKIRAYRVYLGPYQNAAALVSARERLNTLGVKDHYVVRDSDVESAISLGLFSQNKTADNFLRSLKSKNIVAQTRPEMRTLDGSYWLEIRGIGRRGQARDAIQGLQWNDSRTKIKEFQCSQ